MRLICNNCLDVLERVLDLPSEVVGNDDGLDIVPYCCSSFCVDLDLALLDVLAKPVEYLLLPVESKGGRTDD